MADDGSSLKRSPFHIDASPEERSQLQYIDVEPDPEAIVRGRVRTFALSPVYGIVLGALWLVVAVLNLVQGHTVAAVFFLVAAAFGFAVAGTRHLQRRSRPAAPQRRDGYANLQDPLA